MEGVSARDRGSSPRPATPPTVLVLLELKALIKGFQFLLARDEVKPKFLPLPSAVARSWGEWGEWGSCSKSCGKGTRARTRSGPGLAIILVVTHILWPRECPTAAGVVLIRGVPRRAGEAQVPDPDPDPDPEPRVPVRVRGGRCGSAGEGRGVGEGGGGGGGAAGDPGHSAPLPARWPR